MADKGKKPAAPGKPDPFAEIERNQAKLRVNIEQSRKLVDETQRLIEKQRKARSGG